MIASIPALQDLHFLRPEWLWALLPLIVWWAWLWGKKHTAARPQAFDPALFKRLVLDPDQQGKAPWYHRRGLGMATLALAWMLAVLALMGPSWQRLPEPAQGAPALRFILLDLSSSMNQVDLPPSRVERARYKLLDGLQSDPDQRVALLAFAEETHVVVPLTDDLASIHNLLPALSPGVMPVDGSRLAPALSRVLEMIRPFNDQQTKNHSIGRFEVLVISDGVSDIGSALEQTAKIRAQGGRLSVLAVGANAHANNHWDALKQLARQGGGGFSLLRSDNQDLEATWLQPPLGLRVKQDLAWPLDHWVDAGVWLLLPLLLIAAYGARRGLLTIGLASSLLLATGAMNPSDSWANAGNNAPPKEEPSGIRQYWDKLWLRPDQQAAKALAQGDTTEAAQRFQDPRWRAIANYKAGKYSQAIQDLEGQQDADSWFNRGNALARSGDLAGALKAYDQALKKRPDDEDARANRKLIKKLLEQQQNRPQSGNQGQQKDANKAGNKPNDSGSDSGTDSGPDSGPDQANPGQANPGQSQKKTQQKSKNDTAKDEAHKDQSSKNASAQDSPAQPGDKDGADKGDANQAQASNPDQANQQNPAKNRNKPGKDDGQLDSASADQARSQTPPQAADARKTPPEKSQQGRALKPGLKPGQQAKDNKPPAPNQEAISQAASPLPKSEDELALEAWLKQIPDDPSGLLRRKFMWQHLRRQALEANP